MHVAGAADRRRVAEDPGHRLDAGRHQPLGLGGVRRRRLQRQGPRRRQGAGPGPNVLGAEILADGRAQIGVDLGAADRVPDPVVVDVLEETLARQGLAPPEHARQAAIVEVGLVLDAALAAKFEDGAVAVEPDVALAQGRQAKAPVRPGVFVVADADQGDLEKADRRRQHLLPGQTAPAKVGGDAAPKAGEGATEGEDPLELGFVAERSPAGVIAVLLAPARIAADRLDVAIRILADPYTLPSRRDDEPADALEDIGIAHTPPAGVDVIEAMSDRDPADARVVVVDVGQTMMLGQYVGHILGHRATSPCRSLVSANAPLAPDVPRESPPRVMARGSPLPRLRRCFPRGGR